MFPRFPRISKNRLNTGLNWALLRTSNFSYDWLKWRVIYAHFVSRENWFVLCSSLNDWNYFWNKYYNLSFLAICLSQYSLLIFLTSSYIEKQKLYCEWACKIKNWLTTIIKCFVKQQSPPFLSFSFLIDWCMSIFSLFYQGVCKFWKIDKIPSASFHCI